MAKVISFYNEKGGVGKSTLAGAFAAGLASKRIGVKVLVIDTDTQGGGLFNQRQGEISRGGKEGEYTYPVVLRTYKEAATLIIDPEVQKEYNVILVDFPASQLGEGMGYLLKLIDHFIVPCGPKSSKEFAGTEDTIDKLRKIAEIRYKANFKTNITGIVSKRNRNKSLKRVEAMFKYKDVPLMINCTQDLADYEEASTFYNALEAKNKTVQANFRNVFRELMDELKLN